MEFRYLYLTTRTHTRLKTHVCRSAQHIHISQSRTTVDIQLISTICEYEQRVIFTLGVTPELQCAKLYSAVHETFSLVLSYASF